MSPPPLGSAAPGRPSWPPRRSAGPPAAGTYPSSYPYAHTSSLFDITSGSNGSCSPSYLCKAGPGYDGPTGWGAPDGTAAFTG